MSSDSTPPTLACICNFRAGTGYAWDYIEKLYAATATRLADDDIRTFVLYPEVEGTPQTLRGSAAEPRKFDFRYGRPSDLRRALALIRRENITGLYLTDRPSWHPAYPLFRLAGVEWIVVHDHTSGAATRPVGLKRWLKRLTRSMRPMLADRVITVSDYVARRQTEVDLVPEARVHRIHNGLPVPPRSPAARARLHRRFEIPEDRLVIGAASRAAPEKGIVHLVRAFSRLRQQNDDSDPVLVYFGDGPDMSRIREVASAHGLGDSVRLPGYVPGAAELLEGVDICAAPSLWQDALPLSVLEPMARGRPVVASAVGGVPEMVEHGETGILVPPGDEEALAAALGRLIDDPDLRERLGSAARERVSTQFNPEDKWQAVIQVVRQGL